MICHGKTHEDFVVMRKALTFWYRWKRKQVAQNVSAFLITTKSSWVFPWQIIAVLVYGK